jgi:hypothetical protein
VLAKNVYVKLDKEAIGELLKSSEVGSFLEEVGDQVANKAGSEYEVQVDYTSRKSRVVVNVVDPREGALFREQQTGNLARALGSV